MKIDPKTIRSRVIGLALGILMNGNCALATDPTPLDQKADALTPDPTQPDKVLLARGGGGGHGGGGGRGGGGHSGGSRGGGSSHGYSGTRGGSHMSSGRSSGSKSYRGSSPRSKSTSSRTSSVRKSGSTTGTKKATGRSRSSSKVATQKGARSQSVAKRGGRGGRGGGDGRGGGHDGGRGHGGRGRHHDGGHGRHGHHNHDRYWGYGHWYGSWGGWYYPWWGWCFGFSLGLGYGWYGPGWGFWDFPSYWAWYWPGFALSVFYAGLYDATDPHVVVLGENSVNHYAVYTRSQDDDGNVVYIKTDRYGTVNPNEKTMIKITDRSNNVVIIARDNDKLDDTLSSDAVKSKDNYSVVDPSEAPETLEEGEQPEVTDKQIDDFQEKVKSTKNAELLKEKAEAAGKTDTSDAEKEANRWEQSPTTEIAD